MPVNLTMQFEGPAGRLEAILDEPENAPRAAVVVCHPHPLHGGTMHTKALFRAAKAFRSIGCAVLRFNFRGVGASAGTYDEGRGEAQDFTAGLDFMASRYPDVPLWAAGMSFGAFIALTVGAADPRVSLLLGIAAPVDKPALLDALRTSDTAKFFIHGGRDELFPIKTMHGFYAQVPEPKELVVIDGADHLFDGQTQEVGEAVEDLLQDWPG